MLHSSLTNCSSVHQAQARLVSENMALVISKPPIEVVIIRSEDNKPEFEHSLHDFFIIFRSSDIADMFSTSPVRAAAL